MSEHFEYIDAYFQKQLNESEKKEFEQRCMTDEEFASDVALYISSRSALREMLLEEKKIQWGMTESDEVTATISPVRKMNTTRWIAYAAAACLVLAIIVFPFLSKDSPQELANNYVNENLASMSQTMDASSDSVQLGIAAYNKKDYPTAMQFFQGVYRAHPENTDALKYIGQTHLMTGNFDEAIAAFDELSQRNMFANPGLLLKAVTLMKRNTNNDYEVAKGLLQKIVAGDINLDGKREAEKWLKNWPDK